MACVCEIELYQDVIRQELQKAENNCRDKWIELWFTYVNMIHVSRRNSETYFNRWKNYNLEEDKIIQIRIDKILLYC